MFIRKIAFSVGLLALIGCTSQPLVKTGEGFERLDKSMFALKQGGVEVALFHVKSAIDLFQTQHNSFGLARAKLQLSMIYSFAEIKQEDADSNPETLILLDEAVEIFDDLDAEGYKAGSLYLKLDYLYNKQQRLAACDVYDELIESLDELEEDQYEGFHFDQKAFASPYEMVHERFDYYCGKLRSPGLGPEWYDENGRLKSFKRGLDLPES